jgi:hypothetical protein
MKNVVCYNLHVVICCMHGNPEYERQHQVDLKHPKPELQHSNFQILAMARDRREMRAKYFTYKNHKT